MKERFRRSFLFPGIPHPLSYLEIADGKVKFVNGLQTRFSFDIEGVDVQFAPKGLFGFLGFGDVIISRNGTQYAANGINNGSLFRKRLESLSDLAQKEESKWDEELELSDTIISFPLPPEDILEKIRNTVGKRHFNVSLVTDRQMVKFMQPIIGYGKLSDHRLLDGKSGAIISPNEGMYLGVKNNRIFIQVSERSLDTLKTNHFGVCIYGGVYEIVRYYRSGQTRTDWIHNLEVDITAKEECSTTSRG